MIVYRECGSLAHLREIVVSNDAIRLARLERVVLWTELSCEGSESLANFVRRAVSARHIFLSE